MKKKTLFTRLVTGIAVVVLALCALCVVGCGDSSDEGSSSSDASTETVELQIFAANSLEKAMGEVQELYTERNPNITFADSQFKASGDLVEMLVAGASADILITASNSTMDDAESFIIPESRITMFGNDLIVCAAENSDIKINSLEDLTSDKIGKIAIGDPALVPAGKYANQSLYSVSITDSLYSAQEGEGGSYASSIADKVVVADKVGTCAQWTASGNTDIGFIYSSDLYRYEGIKNIYTVPEELHKVIVYPGAIINDSKYQDEAEDFLVFCMTDPDALTIWQENGFELK